MSMKRLFVRYWSYNVPKRQCIWICSFIVSLILFAVLLIMPIFSSSQQDSADVKRFIDQGIALMEKQMEFEADFDEESSDNELEDIFVESKFRFNVECQLERLECQDIGVFNSTYVSNEVEIMTDNKFNEVANGNFTFSVAVFLITPSVITMENVRNEKDLRETKLLCDYLLQLKIAFYFSKTCDDACHFQQTEHILRSVQSIGDELDSSWKFDLPNTSEQLTPIHVRVKNVFLYRIDQFFATPLFVASPLEDRYVSAYVSDSDGLHTSVVMSKKDRSLLRIEPGLDRSVMKKDPLSIYVSLTAVETPKAYLRHKMGRIQLSPFENTDLFKQDATFKLHLANQTENLYLFQSTNINTKYISVDLETHSALFLTEPQSLSGAQSMDNYLFRLIIDQGRK